MIDDPHLATAREFERAARQTLTDACNADIAILDRLCSNAFAKAREALEETLHIAGGGSNAKLDQLRERAQLIAMHCTRRVRDTANIRFRARFRAYTEAVWENETRLLARPRRIALPRLHLRTVEPVIVSRVSLGEVSDAWMGDLITQLRAALQDAVAIAVETVVKRLIASIARSRTAHALLSMRSNQS